MKDQRRISLKVLPKLPYYWDTEGINSYNFYNLNEKDLRYRQPDNQIIYDVFATQPDLYLKRIKSQESSGLSAGNPEAVVLKYW